MAASHVASHAASYAASHGPIYMGPSIRAQFWAPTGPNLPYRTILSYPTQFYLARPYPISSYRILSYPTLYDPTIL
jgi:hypothetical protein